MRPELISQPITGICSFGRYPICLDLDELKADFGVLGVPFDMGVGFLSGARMGPRRIREASTQYGRGEAGYYDYESDEQLLLPLRRLVEQESIPCNRDKRTRIVKAQLGNNAGIIGAALLGKRKLRK